MHSVGSFLPASKRPISKTLRAPAEALRKVGFRAK